MQNDNSTQKTHLFDFLFRGTFNVSVLQSVADVLIDVDILSSGFNCFQIPVLLTSSVIFIDFNGSFMIFPFEKVIGWGWPMAAAYGGGASEGPGCRIYN